MHRFVLPIFKLYILEIAQYVLFYIRFFHPTLCAWNSFVPLPRTIDLFLCCIVFHYRTIPQFTYGANCLCCWVLGSAFQSQVQFYLLQIKQGSCGWILGRIKHLPLGFEMLVDSATGADSETRRLKSGMGVGSAAARSPVCSSSCL